jgi:hypothetical protein
VRGIRRNSTRDLEDALRKNRPRPRQAFVEALAAMVGDRDRRRPVRFAFAVGLSTVLLVGLAAFGGIGQAAGAPAKVVKAVVHVVVGHDDVNVIDQSPACDQYGVKSNSGRGNLSETENGNHQTDSDTLVNPHTGGTGPGPNPTDDCDPGNSGAVNHGGD